MSFNSRPSCDGRLGAQVEEIHSIAVSIHARRVTGDAMGQAGINVTTVSIHARRVTGDC